MAASRDELRADLRALMNTMYNHDIGADWNNLALPPVTLTGLQEEVQANTNTIGNLNANRVAIVEIPAFFGTSGEDPEEWANKFEEAFTANGLGNDDAQRFLIAKAQLKGGAADCVEKLESMSKMITYWKSNAEKEFRFYGKQSKDKQKLNEAELNKRVTEALAEVDDINQDNDEIEEFTIDSTNRNIRSNANERRTTSGELIPEDNAIVLIEHLWIETNVDLSNKRILEDIGEIPDDADDD
ncbi:hypothetical protein GLOIN_2v1815633 [Rhizophagus irregularis DAOM 181602=DAOM 197198]|nr:hypothetical protein GLOIN_2v1815633 [Rhizophagus irregularis DAOM 181602=DAOM 197198]